MTYLGLVSHYRDETPYLREWVTYHRARGVERFLLVNNDAEPEPSEAILAGFPEVQVIRFAGLILQAALYTEMLERVQDWRWVGFLDLDEFALPLQADDLRVVLRDYEGVNGLAVNWQLFGTSGFLYRPTSQINHLLRCARPDFHINHHVKLFANPRALARMLGAHHGEFYNGDAAVDEDLQPVRGWINPRCPKARLRINHYMLRSAQDVLAKTVRRNVNSGRFRPLSELLEHDRNECFCDNISRRFGVEQCAS